MPVRYFNLGYKQYGDRSKILCCLWAKRNEREECHSELGNLKMAEQSLNDNELSDHSSGIYDDLVEKSPQL